MNIKVFKKPTSIKEVSELAEETYGDMIKGVVDIAEGCIALGGEWHMDANNALLSEGSQQEHLWGFNIYPSEKGERALEYVALINIRPRQGNTSMEITDANTKQRMRTVIETIVPELFET